MTCPPARPNMQAVTRLGVVLLFVLASCSTAPSAATAPSPSVTALFPTTTVTPSPARTTVARVMPEAAVWAEVRTSLPPGAPVAVPTWLPATVDRDHVELRDLRVDPVDFRYVVAYLAGKREIVLALGQMPEIAGSGYGMRVRGVPATLTFPTSLWSDAATPATRRVRWSERGHVLSISSDTFTGDDLLHVAWSLDPAGQPPPANAYIRLNEGTCAKVSGPPDEIGTMWGDLPGATLNDTKQVSVTGGRPVVQASWTFASDAGGAWGTRPTRFFDLGLESGRWRIHAINSAPISPPP